MPTKTKKFKAKLDTKGPGGAWVSLEIPFDVEKEFGSKARVSVKGTINKFPFRTSIFPNGDGTHHVMVNKAMRDGAGAKPGDKVTIEMTKDVASRTIKMPLMFKQALLRNSKAKAFFDGLAPSYKAAYVAWIDGAKQQETKETRLRKAISLLSASKKLDR